MFYKETHKADKSTKQSSKAQLLIIISNFSYPNLDTYNFSTKFWLLQEYWQLSIPNIYELLKESSKGINFIKDQQ